MRPSKGYYGVSQVASWFIVTAASSCPPHFYIRLCANTVVHLLLSSSHFTFVHSVNLFLEHLEPGCSGAS